MSYIQQEIFAGAHFLGITLWASSKNFHVFNFARPSRARIICVEPRNFRRSNFRGCPFLREKHEILHHAKISRYTVHIHLLAVLQPCFILKTFGGGTVNAELLVTLGPLIRSFIQFGLGLIYGASAALISLEVYACNLSSGLLLKGVKPTLGVIILSAKITFAG